jgi:hypothetical protein
VTNKQLQNKSTDMSSAMNCINDTKEFLMRIRNDEFEELLVEAKKVAEILGVPPNFEEKQQIVRLRNKKQFMYEQEDQSIGDFKQKFEIDFYVSIINTAIAAVDDKFKHMSVLNENLCSYKYLRIAKKFF